MSCERARATTAVVGLRSAKLPSKLPRLAFSNTTATTLARLPTPSFVDRVTHTNTIQGHLPCRKLAIAAVTSSIARSQLLALLFDIQQSRPRLRQHKHHPLPHPTPISTPIRYIPLTSRLICSHYSTFSVVDKEQAIDINEIHVIQPTSPRPGEVHTLTRATRNNTPWPSQVLKVSHPRSRSPAEMRKL